MLIQAKSPYGRTSVVATSVPSASAMPQPRPMSSISRQSASFWFQPAACESAKQPAMCCGPSATSVLAVTRLEVRRLAEIGHAAGNPVGLPVEHGGERHARRTEKALGGSRVDQPGGRRLFASDGRLLAEALAEFLREGPHADYLGAAHVDWRGRRRAMREEAQRLLVRLALPEDVDVAHADVDRLAREHLGGDVVQHAVAHVDRVFEAHQPAGRAVALRAEEKCLLAPDA